MKNTIPLSTSIQRLAEVVAALRGPQGCPWDKEQNFHSLAPYTVEESYELIEALELFFQSPSADNKKEVCEELGDLFFHLFLYAQVAEDQNLFDLTEVLNQVSDKIIRRHPHVFSSGQQKQLSKVVEDWHQLKNQEHLKKKKKVFAISPGMPSLQRSGKIGKKTEGFQFDWSHAEEVMQKVHEEIQELQQEMNQNPQDIKALEHELGDVLFSVAQLARHLNIEPEQALRVANRRFEQRFETMMEIAEFEDPMLFRNLSLQEKENLWSQAKKKRSPT
jgi:tetrapyrrole methylase family protein/MazG family protein